MPPFTNEEKRAAVVRELGYRKRVYERRVADGKMTRQLADAQIAVFEAILADYDKLAEKERLL
jgi:hypothetical protein